MVIPEKGFNKCAGFQGSSVPMQETWVQSLGQEDPLEQEMATCSMCLPGDREASSMTEHACGSVLLSLRLSPSLNRDTGTASQGYCENPRKNTVVQVTVTATDDTVTGCYTAPVICAHHSLTLKLLEEMLVNPPST